MKWPILLILLILLASSYAFYGDLTFDVKDTGDVEMSGKTDYASFQGTSNVLTSKERNIWSFNLTSPVFDKYTYLITLPKYSAINYITANNKFVIGEKDGVIAVTGSGNKKPLDVFIEYSIDREDNSNNTILIIAGIVLILIIGIAVYIVKRKKTAPKKELKRDLYTERQLKILDYLQKHGNVTQAVLEKELNIPKASLSRNIKTLVQKGIIFSETKGMSNIVGMK